MSGPLACSAVPGLSLSYSVRGRQVSHRELDLAVGKLPPVLDDGRVISLRSLIDDFAGFATRGVDGQLEYLGLLRAGHPGCQIMGANGHVGPPGDGFDNAADHGRRSLKLKCAGGCRDPYPC